MNLRRLTKFKELLEFAPKLVALQKSLEGKWEPDLTQEEFLEALLNQFDSKSYYFGDLVNDELAYFAVLLKQTNEKALFWLFYMNPNMRLMTRSILDQLKVVMKEDGFSTVYSQSTRTSSSYERWLEKFGAEKVAIVYKFKL